jgi:uncharacterized protein
MSGAYFSIVMTESVRRAQTRYYGKAAITADALERDPLGEAEARFIAARDSFYLGSVSESGWPYIQHRGGPSGFLHLVNSTTLAFADYRGNRQLISTGNLLANDRVALFLIDYKNRERLKILGRARVEDAGSQSDLLMRFAETNRRAKVERIVIIEVVSYDWNCPSHITPRYSIHEVEELVGTYKARIAELEAQLRAGSS